MCSHSKPYGSTTSWVLDRIGCRFVVRRGDLYPPELEEARDEEEKRRIQGTVRYVVQVLRKKGMVFLIPKRFVINIPLTLTYYRLNNSVLIVAEALRSGGMLEADEAYAIVERVISNYYRYFEPLINNLLKFYQPYRKILITLGNDEVQYRLESKLYEYLPFILIESRGSSGMVEGDEGKKRKVSRKRRTLEFLRAIVKTVEQEVGKEAIEKLCYRWRELENTIDELSYDDNPHVESITRRFLERTMRYAFVSLLPQQDEIREIMELLKAAKQSSNKASN